MTRDQILNYPIDQIHLAVRDCEGSCIQTVPITARIRDLFLQDALRHNAEHRNDTDLHKVRCEVSAGYLILNSVCGEEVRP